MRLSNYFVDAAHRFFTVAVEKNFVQGRRTTHVVAACLYIACRQEKSQHMLIDFSDALQVNVYILGTCFLKFRRLLGLKLDIIDPALYIYRFAAHLDLDEKANAVALTALRLVGRMKRDWIVAGRRPAGICAAALLIACRAHGFARGSNDVSRVLRVCGMTVHQRVKDFESTPSSNLTLQQFIDIDLETEADPPRFTTNRIKEARAKAIQDGNIALLTSGQLDDPRENDKRSKKWRSTLSLTDRQKQLNQLYDQLATDMGQEDTNDDNGNDNGNGNVNDASPTTTTTTTAAASVVPSIPIPNGMDSSDKDTDSSSRQIVPMTTAASTIETFHYPKGNNGRTLILPDQATAEELAKSNTPEESKLNLEEWKQDMPTSVMDEIDGLFRDDEEVKQKEAIFNKMNKDYIEKQARLENARLAAEKLMRETEDMDAAQAEEQARYMQHRKTSATGSSSGGGGGGIAAAAAAGATGTTRRTTKHGGSTRMEPQDKSVSFQEKEAMDRDDDENDEQEEEDNGPTTEEALLAAISSRKISRKINYDAMSTIFNDEGTFSMEMLEDYEPEKTFMDDMI